MKFNSMLFKNLFRCVNAIAVLLLGFGAFDCRANDVTPIEYTDTSCSIDAISSALYEFRVINGHFIEDANWSKIVDKYFDDIDGCVRKNKAGEFVDGRGRPYQYKRITESYSIVYSTSWKIKLDGTDYYKGIGLTLGGCRHCICSSKFKSDNVNG